jgi:hypothetical protein
VELPDLQWERGAERLTPVPNEKGELVFKDDLVVAENAFITLGKWNGASVQSLTVTHEAEDARGQIAVASAELKQHQKKLDTAVLTEDAAAIKEYAADVANCAMFVAWAAGLLAQEDDSPGNRGQVFGPYSPSYG